MFWAFAEKCRIGSTPQSDWYFFSHKDKKYPTGTRTNRATVAGFWKATGRDKVIYSSFSKIGMRKTLVFYKGRAPHGQKSDWIMHEYRLDDASVRASSSRPIRNNTSHALSLCEKVLCNSDTTGLNCHGVVFYSCFRYVKRGKLCGEWWRPSSSSGPNLHHVTEHGRNETPINSAARYHRCIIYFLFPFIHPISLCRVHARTHSKLWETTQTAHFNTVIL